MWKLPRTLPGARSSRTRAGFAAGSTQEVSVLLKALLLHLQGRSHNAYLAGLFRRVKTVFVRFLPWCPALSRHSAVTVVISVTVCDVSNLSSLGMWGESSKGSADGFETSEISGTMVTTSGKCHFRFSGTSLLIATPTFPSLAVENENHCDFVKLREMLIRVNMEDLREQTHTRHYELYRRCKLEEMGFKDTDPDSKPFR